MPWAIYSDLSGVCEIEGASIPTEGEAIERLILALESNKTDVTDKIAKAKARRRALNRRKT